MKRMGLLILLFLGASNSAKGEMLDQLYFLIDGFEVRGPIYTDLGQPFSKAIESETLDEKRVEKLVEEFRRYLSKELERAMEEDDYSRQRAAFGLTDVRIQIFTYRTEGRLLTLFLASDEKEITQKEAERGLVFVHDGGHLYWSVIYSHNNKTFTNFAVNGN